jgi:hypothetical protein
MLQRSVSVPSFEFSLLDQAVFASVSAMSVFALFSPLLWGLG